MKRYDDVNIIKAYACLAVFGSHWFGTFGSWGSNKVNALMEIGPLPLLRYGTFGVSLFLMISGMLIADKVYSGRFTSWSLEILRRYLKLTCPLTVTFLLAYLFYRSGLFYTVRVAPRLENEWLSNFYSYLPGGLKAIRYAWFDTIFKADSTYYGPSWMLTYTFMGSILTLVLSSALREVGTRQKILILAGVAAVLIGLNSFYICLLLGNGICLLMRAVEKSMKERERKENLLKDGEGKYGIFGAALWIFSIWFVRKSFWIGTTLGAHGFPGGLGTMEFYGHVAAFLMILGFRLPLFQILVLDKVALVHIAIDDDLAEGHRLFTLRDSFHRKDAFVVQHTAVVESGLESLGHINGITIFGKIHLGDLFGVCQFGIDWERLCEETFVRQPSTVFILAIGEVGNQVLVLWGGIFEGKDESAPSALHPAVIGSIDNAPFDTIAFFL